jgi:hypothetical protein
VARAKRTDRAEARRRYRIETLGEDLDTPVEGTATPGSTSAKATRPASAPGQMPRMGIGNAFKTSFRPLDLRSDLRAIPELLRSRALWIPIGLTVGSAVAVAVLGVEDPIGQILFTYFVTTPAIGGVFLAGFLAKRASWLLGFAVGVVSAASLTALILSGLIEVPANLQAATISYAFLLSPIMGALFAASAAWYRRFLQASNPNRGRSASPKSSDGRSRGGSQKSGSQKASARR